MLTRNNEYLIQTIFTSLLPVGAVAPTTVRECFLCRLYRIDWCAERRKNQQFNYLFDWGIGAWHADFRIGFVCARTAWKVWCVYERLEAFGEASRLSRFGTRYLIPSITITCFGKLENWKMLVTVNQILMSTSTPCLLCFTVWICSDAFSTSKTCRRSVTTSRLDRYLARDHSRYLPSNQPTARAISVTLPSP